MSEAAAVDPQRLEHAKAALKKQVPLHGDVTLFGIPITAFDRDDLLRIVTLNGREIQALRKDGREMTRMYRACIARVVG